MRQVRTCDFCGDDATGLYEPLPASVPDGPRLLLCDPCRDRLGTVVDPLLAQLESDPGDEAASRDRTTEAPDGGSGLSPTAESRPPAPEGPADQPGAPGEPTESARQPGASSVVGESRDASGRSQRERGGTPRGYRKVLRLLENRELPMAREDAEHLAAEAYELEPAEVAEAIDHAVEYGRLREVNGQLKQ